jgi:hypothetical protein
MHLQTPLCSLVSAGLACLAFALPGFAAQEEDPFAVWKDQFERAMKINAKPEMARLVKQDDRMAVGWVLDTCERISEGSSEELETFIAALEEAWETSMKTKFVRRVYEYFSLIDPAIKRERTKLTERYEADREKYEANLEKKDGPTFTRLSNEFEAYAKAFVELGDHYFASQAWYLYAECWMERQRGSDANNFKACAGYKAMLEHRDKIELQDTYYISVQTVYKELKAKGFDQGEAEAAAKGGPGPGVVAAASSASVKLGFEVVEEIDAFERPSYYADELFPVWNALALQKKGSSAKFLAMPEGPTVLRVGANEVMVDSDGDGTGEVEIPITGNVMPVELELSIEGKKQPWAFLAVVGNQQSTFQGLQMNLAPDDQNMSIYVFAAGSMLGDLDGVPIRVIDDNMDGVYGSSKPESYGHIGLVLEQKMFQPEIDSIVVGDAKRALPWSEFVDVGGQWYHLEPQPGGQELKATKVDLETGTFELKFKGGKPTWLVLQGTGQFENSYFDVAGASKVAVPAGYYKLCFGVLSKGKKQQMLKAVILGGPKTEWKVEKGGTTTIELGAPFAFDFEYETADESITVRGTSVHVLGAAGERYGRLWNCVARPEASYRKAGTKKGSKPDKMRLLESQEQITLINNERPGEGWTAAWFPLDIVLEKDADETDVEVQLVEDKNKLFGKIESEWK